MTRRDHIETILCVLALFVLLVASVALGHRADVRAAQWERIATVQAGQLQVLNIGCAVHPSGAAECPDGSFRIETTTSTTTKGNTK